MKKGKATKNKRFPSWQTTDEYEIELRRTRAKEEAMKVVQADGGYSGIFRDYWVTREDVEDPVSYRVELRSSWKMINTCSCPDFEKNFLGTCKHIEKVLLSLAEGKKSIPVNSDFIEIFMNRSPYEPRLALPRELTPDLGDFINKYLDVSGQLKHPAGDTLQVLLRDLENVPGKLRNRFRISFEAEDYNRKRIEQKRLGKLFEQYAVRLRENHGETGFLRYPLYDYQIEGMLHLAFAGRAMLADEMGLGKTVQAVAAAAVMNEAFGVRRVLVVSPASLKTEWEEQIRKFTSLPVEIVFGNRKQRLEFYRNSHAFFLLTNYEQVVRDYDDINRDFQPNLVVLDEAQRIKNWRTKTAAYLKRLQSRYAFVLTGTPIENKIDELYSLVEFVNPTLFGSLFQFNRRFYNFDENGKTAGCKNLRELHETTAQVMLRRRKDEISEQLPERIDNNYFVNMTREQKLRYDDNANIVARLYQASLRRPLSPQEFERMQHALGRMRMLCDTVYILDVKIKESPKIDELMKILEDLWDDEPNRKIIIFSEWVKMLELAAEIFDKRKIAYALHVGYVNQVKRREEINRFKNNPDCRIFLSSDSGGVGLNLQAASVVINLDLPWNPAKLEQRIARAWRKHQKNTVNVINLVAENTIEHKMLATLKFKQGLADAVLDARGDFDDFEKPNAKAAFMERLSAIMEVDTPAPATTEKPSVPPHEQLAQELQIDNPGIGMFRAVYDQDGGTLRGAVAVGPQSATGKLKQLIEKTHGEQLADDKLVVLTPENHAMLQQLAKLGIITINNGQMTKIFETENFQPPRPPDRKLRLKLARQALSGAERDMKMAEVLKSGGFDREAVPPAKKAVLDAALALYVFAAGEPPEQLPVEFREDMVQLIKNNLDFDRTKLMFLQLCAHDLNPEDNELTSDARAFVATACEFINKQALE